MEDFLDILKYTIPALAVLAAAYFSIKNFLDHDCKRKMLQLKADNKKVTIPMRIQAFERIILFLERISPNNIIIRLNKPGISAAKLQSDLLTTIRKEYEHNLVQQLYVSHDAWELVKQAKEEMIRLVNIAASKQKPNATGLDLSKTILELIAAAGQEPTGLVIKYVKKEVSALF